jgi:FkbM family methyltransferase
MKTRNYFGWTVLEEDNRYGPALEKNIDYTKESEKELKEILEHVGQTRCALEIGVHYGFGTRLLSENFDHVNTFDFDNDVHQCFKLNMQKFDVNNLTVHPYGIGANDSFVATNDVHPRKGRGPLANHVDVKQSSDGKKYKIRALDNIKFEHVDLMCIDTEGYELFVLKGGEHTIMKHRPVMVIEFHHRNLSQKFFNVSPKTTEDYIDHLGYRYVKNLNKVDRLYIPK